MERIIIGLDAEHAESPAVDWVVRRAQDAPVDVTLVTAYDSLVDSPIDARRRLLAMADRLLAQCPGSEVQVDLADAPIYRALSQRSETADLLVIGSHRSRAIRSLLNGEIAALIATHSRCPTVIVPDDWSPRDGDIVVGVGIDDTSDEALVFGVQESRRRSSALRLVHAWEATAGTKLSAHERILHTAVVRLRTAYPNARLVENLAQQTVVDAILEHAETAELVVIGTHHHEPAVGLLLGSTSSHLLRHSRVPLCIVPEARELAASMHARA